MTGAFACSPETDLPGCFLPSRSCPGRSPAGSPENTLEALGLYSMACISSWRLIKLFARELSALHHALPTSAHNLCSQKAANSSRSWIFGKMLEWPYSLWVDLGESIPFLLPLRLTSSFCRRLEFNIAPKLGKSQDQTCQLVSAFVMLCRGHILRMDWSTKCSPSALSKPPGTLSNLNHAMHAFRIVMTRQPQGCEEGLQLTSSAVFCDLLSCCRPPSVPPTRDSSAGHNEIVCNLKM